MQHIPLYVPDPAINWNEFMDLLEEERGFKHRGFYPTIRSEAGQEYLDTCLKDNNMYEYKYCLQAMNPNQDWPKDSMEMKKRIELNMFIQKHVEPQWLKEYPYVDFWHYVIDNHEISNGCYFHLERITKEDFVNYATRALQHTQHSSERTIERMADALYIIQEHIFDAAKEYDDNGCIIFWVWW